jgi:lipoprotein-releasing system permease protein
MISLTGVMLGVLVLIVVMAVYAGLERDVKSRLLGFTPHVLLQQRTELGLAPVVEWREAAARAAAIPGVEGAYAYVHDNVVLDINTYQRPISFRGVDTSDPEQVAGLERMLDLETHPDSSADLGIDDRVVVSSIVAEQYGIGVGQRVQLISTRNFERVAQAYRVTDNPPLRELFEDEWKAATDSLAQAWSEEGDEWTVPVPVLEESYDALMAIYAQEQEIRSIEFEMLANVIEVMQQAPRDAEAGVFRFTQELREQLDEAVNALAKTDEQQMNHDVLANLRTFILPKEAEVVGIYLASQMAVTPDLFVPLPLAQDLAGLDDGVQGIGLRLEDSYQADKLALSLRDAWAPDWIVSTWMDQFQAFALLINQQRMMMYFALSFIVLVSAFSMMAVMFTVTIQKRREIGVMKALGAAPGQIVRVFLYQGMILGVLGSALGVGLGHVVIRFRGTLQDALRGMGFDPFSASFTGFHVLPAHHEPVEQVVIAVMAFVLCSLAALVPAFFAARSDAAKSLRNL